MQNISKVFRLPAVIVGIFLAGFYSCQKEEAIVKESSSSSKEEIRVENGYLVFANEAQFNNTLAAINKSGEADLHKWEGLGFTSKKAQIDKALKAYGQATTQEEVDAVKEHYNDLLLFGKEGQIVGSAFPLLQRAALINADGIVKVGKDLYVFKNDRVITIKNGNLSQVDKALQLTSSDEPSGILVSKIYTSRQVSPEDKNARTAVSVNYLQLCYSFNGCLGTDLPVQKFADIYYSWYVVSASPVYGYNFADYEINCQLSTVQRPRCQYAANYNAVLSLNVRSATFEYDAGDPSIEKIYRTFTNTLLERYNYLISIPMFAGRTFIRQGGSFTGARVTISHRSSVNGAVLCDEVGRVVTW